MNVDGPYFKTEISNIPVTYLKEAVLAEVTKLLFDFGQKVETSEPEFQYLVNETTATLRNNYSRWKLNYLDECFRRGKLDQFDRGQKVTVKRIMCWFKSFDILTLSKLQNKSFDKVCSEEDNARFARNSRYGNVIKFRQSRKPYFDEDEWTLKKIEETEEFKAWDKRGYSITGNLTDTLTFKKIK